MHRNTEDEIPKGNSAAHTWFGAGTVKAAGTVKNGAINTKA